MHINTPTRILKLYEHHKSVLSEHLDFWNQIARISSPTAVRTIEETGEEVRRVKSGQRRNIYNDMIIDAKNIAVSGLMAGMTPRETPWFNTAISVDGQLMSLQKFGPGIRQLIDLRTDALRLALYNSNFYSTLSEFYQDALNFGNAGMLMDEGVDLKGTLQYEYVPLGTYLVIEDGYGKVNGFIRRLSLTTYQVVQRFLTKKDGTIDWSLASNGLKAQWDADQWYNVHTVYHSILPKAKGKPYESCYFLKDDHRDQFLSKKEYSYFPFYFFRWSKRQGEPYAQDCPGMQIYHSNDYMQELEKGLMAGYKQKADPTLKVTTGIDLGDYNRKRHGGVVYVDDWDSEKLEPLFGGMMYPYSECEAKIQRIEDRIRQAYFNNMFMAFLQAGSVEKTREEIIRKYEEKLVQLNPVMGRLMADFLNPMLRDAATILETANIIPNMNDVKSVLDEVSAQPIEGRVELVPVYTSLVMMAMQSLGLEGVNDFFATVGSLDQLAQDPVERSLDWVDRDSFVLWKAESNNIPSQILRSADVVNEIRAQRAEQLQQQQQLQMQAQQAQTVEALLRSNRGQG